MPGPMPTPTAILEARGSGLVSKRKGEPKPPVGVPKCPACLSRQAKKAWREMSKSLESQGLITVVDWMSFACLCQAWAEFEIATRMLDEEGRTIKTTSGYMQPHPAVSMQRSAWASVKAYSALFGLDPADRARMNIAPPKEEKKDGKSKYFRTVG